MKYFLKAVLLAEKSILYFFQPSFTLTFPLKSVFDFWLFLWNLNYFSNGFTGNTTLCFFTKPFLLPSGEVSPNLSNLVEKSMFCLQKRWKRVRFGESREPGVFLFLVEVSPNLSSLVEKKHVKKWWKGVRFGEKRW